VGDGPPSGPAEDGKPAIADALSRSEPNRKRQTSQHCGFSSQAVRALRSGHRAEGACVTPFNLQYSSSFFDEGWGPGAPPPRSYTRAYYGERNPQLHRTAVPAQARGDAVHGGADSQAGPSRATAGTVTATRTSAAAGAAPCSAGRPTAGCPLCLAFLSLPSPLSSSSPCPSPPTWRGSG